MVRPPAPQALDSIDFTRLARPGDGVVIAQFTSEPLDLAERFYATPDLPALEVFVGANMSGSLLQARAPGLRFSAYGAMLRTAELVRRDALTVLPLHYSRIGAAFAAGQVRADLVMMQAARDPASGRLFVGATHGYMVDAARCARVLLVEVNARAPVVRGGELPDDLRIHHLVESDRPLPIMIDKPPSADETSIAGHAASVIPDGATVQIGIGSLPHALLKALGDHRDLGFHSGMLTDEVMHLMQAGVINNRRKTIDRGISVGGALVGSAALYAFGHDNPAIKLAAATYTHAREILASIDRLVTLNSVIEVDLLGRVNSERAGGRPMGGIGGLADFARGARAAREGKSIIALPSTARGGAVSRIVARLEGPATMGEDDADIVATEWGVAHLRDQSIAQRVRQLVAVAHPAHRDALQAAARQAGWA